MENYLIQQVRVLDPISGSDCTADVLIYEGKITTIEDKVTSFKMNTNIIDGQELVIGPGLVDIHSHTGFPGHEERENIATLAATAAAGGFTRISILPDCLPSIDNPSVLELLKRQCKTLNTDVIFQFWGALTLDLSGEKMTEISDLASAGVIGFADGYPLENLGLLRRLLEYLQPFNLPIALVASNTQLKGKGVMREGYASISFGLQGIPVASETAAIAATLEVVEAIQKPVHLMKVSTARGVELIADAKARGVPVTASTTWMHLLLNTDSISSYDPNLRLEPPLGNYNDMLALIQGVKEGIIDAIAIDHTPYTYEEKALAFEIAPPGVIGLELALPLLWQRFVASGEWSAIELWKALSVNPSLCLGQNPPSCAVSQPAELVLFDPLKTWNVSKDNLCSLSSNTPWLGKEITGKVIRIWNHQ